MSKQHQNEIGKFFKYRPIAYNPGLAIIFNSPNAGILMSQLLYWHELGKRPDGWIFKTISEMYQETGLTRDQQDTAIRILKKYRVIETKLAGVPAKRHFKLNIDELKKCIPSLKKSHKLTYPNPPNMVLKNKQSITENTQKTTTEITANKLNELKNRKAKLVLGMKPNYQERRF